MAFQSYRIGQTVVQCKPLVHTLANRKKGRLCDLCFRPIETSFDCGRCLHMFYCSEWCLHDDEDNHRLECYYFDKWYKKLKQHYPRLLLRLYLMVKEDSRWLVEDYVLYNGNNRSLNGLTTQSKKVKFDFDRMDYFHTIYELFDFMMDFEVNYNLLFRLFCQTVMNDYDIVSFDRSRAESVGVGLYIEGSVLNHSCEPNAVTVYSGTTLVVKAIKPIEVGDQITINYVDLELSWTQRQSILKNTFYFECDCERCLSEDSAINLEKFFDLKDQIRDLCLGWNPHWNILSKMCDHWLFYCYQVYNRLHPQLISLLVDILSVKLQNRSEDVDRLNEFIDELRKSISLIYGRHHEMYKSFNECRKTKTLQMYF